MALDDLAYMRVNKKVTYFASQEVKDLYDIIILLGVDNLYILNDIRKLPQPTIYSDLTKYLHIHLNLCVSMIDSKESMNVLKKPLSIIIRRIQ